MTTTLRFRWGGGATWLLAADGFVLACDPVLGPIGTVHDYGLFRSTRMEPPALSAGELAAVDLWLLTHGHLDHLDDPGLEAIAAGATVFCDATARRRLRARPAEVLGWGFTRSITRHGATVTVEAVPAIHARTRLLGKLIGDGNGYLVSISRGGDPLRIQVTGDARLGPELEAAVARFRPHVLIANCGAAHVGRGPLGRLIGRITMNGADVRELAALAPNALVIAVHHGTFDHYAEGAPPMDPRIVPLPVGGALDLSAALRRG